MPKYRHGSFQAFLEEENARIQAEQEAKLKPLVKQHQDTLNRLARVEKVNVSKGIDEIYVPEGSQETTLTPEEVLRWNINELQRFHEADPAFGDYPENWKTLTKYLQGRVRVVNQQIIQAAYQKLLNAGLLTVPQPVVTDKPLSEAERNKLAVDEFLARNPEFPKNQANLALMIECVNAYGEGITVQTLEKSYKHLQKEKLLQYPQPEKTNGEWGLNPDSGEYDKWYPQHVVDKLSSEEYKRLFGRNIAKSISSILNPVPRVMRRNDL